MRAVYTGLILAEDLRDLDVSLNQLAPLSTWRTDPGTAPQYWMNPQANYAVKLAEHSTGKSIAREVIPYRAAWLSACSTLDTT